MRQLCSHHSRSMGTGAVTPRNVQGGQDVNKAPQLFVQRPTADLCDAYPSIQVVDQSFCNYGGAPSCGGPVEIISTVNDNSVVRGQLEQPGHGRVLVIDNKQSKTCAMLGGSLARLAAKTGWAGVVVNGAVRDVQDLRATPIAIFAIGVCPRRSKKHKSGAVVGSARFGGVIVRQKDILVADSDGMVVLQSWAVSGDC